MAFSVLIAVALAVSCWVLHRRLVALRDRLENAERMAELRWSTTRDRLAALEGGVPEPAAAPPLPIPAAAEPVSSAPEPVAPPPPPPAPPPRPRTVPAIERLRDRLRGQEWETVLGGSWLNKLGVLVLVIGIALFMGYSMTQLDPAGRVALAAATGIALLAGGIVVERRPHYMIFGRGLISGGWAILYFTAYASHAVDAARVIDDPMTGTALLAGVSAGMILHTLRYRSQAVTILAYIAAFAALSFTPLSFFAVLALIPLTASLLFIADRFNWQIAAVLALPGVYCLYFFHALRIDGGNLLNGQALLVGYWLLFELFDIRMAAKRVQGKVLAALFPLNALAFVNLAWLQWNELAPETLWGSFALGALLLLGSAAVRMGLDRKQVSRYIGPLVIASFLAVISIFLRFDGMSVNLALLIEGELLFLAGLFLRLPVLRWLGAGVFAVAGLKLAGYDLWEPGRMTVAGTEIRDWSPLAMLKVFIFYLNRRLQPKAGLYGHAAAAALALTIMFELPLSWVGPGLLIAAGALLAFGERAAQADFRLQAIWMGGISFAALLGINVFGIGVTAGPLPWLPQAAGAALCLALTAHLQRSHRIAAHASSATGTAVAAALLWNIFPEPGFAVSWAALAFALVWAGHRLEWLVLRAEGHVLALLTTASLFDGSYPERLEAVAVVLPVVALHYWVGMRFKEPFVQRAYLYSASALAMMLAAVLAPDEWIAAGLTALAIALVVAGERWQNFDFRLQSLLIAVLAACVCALNTLPDHGVLPGAVVVAGLFAGQLLSAPRFRPVFAFLATAVLTLLLYYQVSGELLTVAWGVAGLSLLVAGFPLRERILRLAGLALLLACIVKLFAFDLRNLEMPDRILSFIILGVILIGVSWFYTRFRERIIGFFGREPADSAAPPE